MGASQSAADPKGSAPGRAAGVVSQRQRPSSGTGSSVLAQATGVEAVPDHTRRACVREMSCSSAVWSVRLSADSTWIVTGDESRRVIIWDALKAAKVREMECDGQVTAVDILADGSSVVSGDLSGHVCVWDATSGALRTLWATASRRNSSPRGRAPTGRSTAATLRTRWRWSWAGPRR